MDAPGAPLSDFLTDEGEQAETLRDKALRDKALSAPALDARLKAWGCK